MIDSQLLGGHLPGKTRIRHNRNPKLRDIDPTLRCPPVVQRYHLRGLHVGNRTMIFPELHLDVVRRNDMSTNNQPSSTWNLQSCSPELGMGEWSGPENFCPTRPIALERFCPEKRLGGVQDFQAPVSNPASISRYPGRGAPKFPKVATPPPRSPRRIIREEAKAS